MARPFSRSEATQLIVEHKKMIDRINALQESESYYKDKVKTASEELAAKEVMNTLTSMPVEEINRGKRGFRIKALRKSGYHTVADIVAASVYSLSSIYGVSAESAYAMKQIANNIAADVKVETKIKLSVDNKTKEASALVRAIERYSETQKVNSQYQSFFISTVPSIEDDIEELNSVINPLKWLFSSRSKKEAAIEAYQRLIDGRNGEYEQIAKAYLLKMDDIRNAQTSESWQSFTRNPVNFFNVLEDINPEILGNDDASYGLPEGLAQEIQDQAFFPDGLSCELRRYQEWGVKYVLHQGNVLLGDEMGLGKTVQAIATMVSLKNTGATHFVVVCPASVLANWCREIRKMSLLSVTKVHGSGRRSELTSWLKTGGVAVTTYETTGFFDLPKDFRFSMLIVDEAHYIKNPEARRTQNVKELATRAERLLFMTGTPIENKVEEMVSLISILQPRLAAHIRSTGYQSSPLQFRKEVAPVYYRRKRDDVLTEMPDLIESKEWCTLNRVEKEAYEAAVLDKSYALSRRVSWNVKDIHDSSKATRLLQLCQEAEADDRKIIVFSFFLATIKEVTLLLGDKCMEPINGSVSPQKRQDIIDEFDKAPPGQVLVAQIQSGGTGLNIQSASVVILCEPQLKPSIENQAISRAYRMGQTRNVLVYRLLCEGTVDEKIMSNLEEKQALFDDFADKSEAAMMNQEIDDKTFGNMIEEEIERINAEHDKRIS